MATKYASEKKKKDYVLAPGGFQLDWYGLQDDYPDEINSCFLVALNRRQLAVLAKLAHTFLPWRWLWNVDKADEQAISDIQDWKENLEYCLMAGCSVQDLIATQRMLVAAIAGQSVDLASDLPQGVVDFSPNGVSTRLHEIDGTIQSTSEQTQVYLEDIAGQLTDIASHLATIAQNSGEQIEDELQGIIQKVETIGLILGAVA